VKNADETFNDAIELEAKIITQVADQPH